MKTFDSEMENGMNAGLGALFFQVREFHNTFAHPAPERPTMLSFQDVHRRARWIESEVVELCEATTIVGQADAFVDQIYFAVGGLVEMGINPAQLWNLVQAANMNKRFSDGSIRRRESDGKIMKPPGWVDPTAAMQIEIHRQMDTPESCIIQPTDGYYEGHAGAVAAQGGVEVPKAPAGTVTQNEPGGLQVPGVPGVPTPTFGRVGPSIAVKHPDYGIVGYVRGPLGEGDTISLERAWLTQKL